MRIRCIKEFRDAEAGNKLRHPGDAWEATAERLVAINSAGYGRLCEPAPEKPAPKKRGPRKAAEEQ